MTNPQTNQFRVEGRSPNQPKPSHSPTLFEMSVSQSRLLDDQAQSIYKIPTIILMENAAIKLAHHTRTLLDQARTPNITIFAGQGNKQGDSFALARQLNQHHIIPHIVLIPQPDQIQGDARTNLDIITQMGIPITQADEYLNTLPTQAPGLIIDALFGTGLSRPPSGTYASIIDTMNTYKAQGSLILSIDVPSGLDAQTGTPLSKSTVQADRTITLAALKEGFRQLEAQPFLGELFVEPIGLPQALIEKHARKVEPEHS